MKWRIMVALAWLLRLRSEDVVMLDIVLADRMAIKDQADMAEYHKAMAGRRRWESRQ